MPRSSTRLHTPHLRLTNKQPHFLPPLTQQLNLTSSPTSHKGSHGSLTSTQEFLDSLHQPLHDTTRHCHKRFSESARARDPHDPPPVPVDIVLSAVDVAATNWWIRPKPSFSSISASSNDVANLRWAHFAGLAAAMAIAANFRASNPRPSLKLLHICVELLVDFA